MQDKRSSNMRPLFVTILLWLCSVAYLMFFLLAPLQNWMRRRSRKRARHHLNARTSDSGSHPSH